MPEWLPIDPQLAWWLGGLSLATFLGSLVVVPLLILRMPADYFLNPEPPPDSWRGRHPVIRALIAIAKNSLGGVLFVAGLLMFVIPGQGLLTMLVGLTLIDFPGKRRLEMRFIAQPRIERALAWMRRKAGRPPLQLPSKPTAAAP